MVGLPAAVAARRAGTYSLGTRQRLTLAAALLGDPRVIVLDEPTTGLDVHGVAWLRRQLREWASAGRTVLVASHSLTELAPMADRVLVLDRGRLAREADRAELGHGADLQTVLFDLLTAQKEDNDDPRARRPGADRRHHQDRGPRRAGDGWLRHLD